MTTTAAPMGVEATAGWIAAARAQERTRPDALVDDPWAEALAGEAGIAWARAVTARAPDALLPIIVRARYFDDWLLGQIARGMPMQVVILGAGLDTRAWRLVWPAGTTVYEVDRAAVLGHKATTMLAAGATLTCARVEVPADLLGDWPVDLLHAGMDPADATTFLAEGILFYLPDAGLRRVLGAVTALAAADSLLGFDIPDGRVLTSPYTKPWVDMQAAAGAPWRGTMDDPAAELNPAGWVVQVRQPGEGDTSRGRWSLPVPPAGSRELPHSWYVTARRTGG